MRFLLALLLLAAPVRAAGTVVIICDDLSWDAVPWTNPYTSMPTLQKIADRGVRYDAVYGYSVCVPSFASLLTGVTPAVHGITTNISIGTPLSVPLLVSGRAFCAGKWWFQDPLTIGFEAAFLSPDLGRVTQQPVFDWLDTVSPGEDWFLWWAPTMPHEPHNAPQAFLDRVPFAMDRPPYLAPEYSTSQWRSRQWQLLAMASWWDHEVRKLGKALRARGLDDATILVIADNGYHIGTPSKGTWFSTGVRCVTLVVGPNTPGGTVDTQLHTIEDISRAVLAGEALPPRECLVYPLYKWEPAPARVAYWVYRDSRYSAAFHPLGVTADPCFAMRTILAHRPLRAPGQLEVYDLLTDPYELTPVPDPGGIQEKIDAVANQR